MWKAAAGYKMEAKGPTESNDDWETDADYINQMSEEEQRYGSAREIGAIDMKKFREEAIMGDAETKQKDMEQLPKASYGYGGKFGIEKDRMDSSAMSHEFVGKVEKHGSQKDYSSGFGGKFGIQADRQDKSAAGWDHIEKVEKHQSQKDYARGFGGKFGIQKDRQDKSAAGWDYIEKVEKHESQKDYSVGFGGKFGVQTDRQDKSAAGWDHIEPIDKHESQKDYSVGFGGKFGVQSDRQDKSAAGWDHIEKVDKHQSQKDYSKGFGGKFGVQDDRQDQSAYSWDYIEKVEKHESQTDYNIGFGGKYGIQSDRQDKSAAGWDHIEKVEKHASQTGFVEKFDIDMDRMDRVPLSSSTYYEKTKVDISDASEKASSIRARFENIASNAQSELNKPKLPVEVVKRRSPPEKLPETKKLSPTLDDKIQKHEVNKIQDKIGSAQTQYIETHFETERKVENSLSDVEQERKNLDAEVRRQEELLLQESVSVLPQDRKPEAGHDQDRVTPDTHGITAFALYDYQAADTDEISFDPDDIVTNIEMIDEGWWRGFCNGQYGLFPANYVQLLSTLEADT